MPVYGPEPSQHPQGPVGQRHQPVLVALGIANVDPHVVRVDIADGEADTFTKAKPHAVAGKEKDPVTPYSGCGKQLPHLRDGEDIGYSGCPGRLDQGEALPGFAQYLGVEELQTVEIEFDRAPGMCLQKIGEIVEQLL